MAGGLEPAGHPLQNLVLALFLELHRLGVGLQGGVQLLIGLAGLVLDLVVDDHQTAVGGKILQQGDEARPLLLAELVEVPVHHLHHGPLGHHRHGLHGFRQGLDCQPLALQLVEVEILEAGHQAVFHFREVVLPQVALLAVKEVHRPQTAGGERLLQLSQATVPGGFAFNCHIRSSPQRSVSEIIPKSGGRRKGEAFLHTEINFAPKAEKW